ncbi:hypothetical protein [Tropheryma whipplei]|uniref:Uncharacterized protein n=1 Tax=Tropheryma whipplei (strain Twist) TaxID=203267 RepID=Q83GA9_TROWT|nr:hypothetical protein [Tropheryma whipplei]AAO44501.1 unknown [Tropheryma whipplei str. Twist]
MPWERVASVFDLPAVQQALIMSAGVIVSVFIASCITRSSVKKLLKRDAILARKHAAECLIDTFLEFRNQYSLEENKRNSDQTFERCTMHIAIMPQYGAKLLVDWAGQIAGEVRRATLNGDTDAITYEFRDRVALWVKNPRKATKGIREDISRFRSENPSYRPLTGKVNTNDEENWHPQEPITDLAGADTVKAGQDNNVASEPYRMRPGFDTAARDILRQVKDIQAGGK